MGVLKKTWAAIGHAFTLQSLLLLLFPTGVVLGLAIWLSTITNFVRLFAPLSYLFVALVAMILTLAVVFAMVNVAKQLGWKPSRRPLQPKLPPRDAPLGDVIMYVGRQSFYGLTNTTGQTPIKVIEKELMDRICEQELVVWGRVGAFPIEPIGTNNLKHSQMSARNLTVTRTGEWGNTVFTDIHMSWKQVRRTWPKPSLWQRLRSDTPKAEPEENAGNAA